MENLYLERVREGATDWVAAVADPIRVHILRSLSHGDLATASELATTISASRQTLRRHLDALVVSGILHEHPGKSDGETPGRPASRFSLRRPETGDNIRQLLGTAP